MDRDQWQEILTVLGRNKLRTFLTAFGVFWGIFMLVIMLGSGKGLENGTIASMGGSATNSVYMWTQQTSMPYQGFKRGRTFNIKMADVEAIRNEIPEIEIISARCQSGGYRGSSNVMRGTKVGAFNIYGDMPEYLEIDPVNIIEGRFINQRDLREKRKLCIIGEEVYKTLYQEGEQALGTYLKAQGVNFKVVGVFRSNSSNPERAEDQEKAIFIPLTTFQQAYNYGDIVGWLSFTGRDDVPASEVEERAAALIRQRHKVHPDDPRAVGSWNAEEEYNNLVSLMSGIRLLSLIVGSLTLLAGAIGVSNIMLVIVKERTREFGTRRALGAPPWAIMKQVVLESVFLTLLAGIIGIMAGVWLLEAVAALMNQFAEGEGGFFRNPGVDLGVVLMSLLILVLAGILAGIIPARRAVAVRPVEALRYE